MHYASRRTTFRIASFKTYFEGKFVQTHDQTNYKCLPKLVKTDNASSSIKTANLLLSFLLLWGSLLRLFYDTYRDISPRWYHLIPFLLSHDSEKLSCLVCFVCCYFPGATRNLYKKRYQGLACFFCDIHSLNEFTTTIDELGITVTFC